MVIPDLERIRRERAEGSTGCYFCTEFVHPNPRFYKYYWWVFWCESPVDGLEFLDDKYRLNVASAKVLADELIAKGEVCWLYNKRLPRNDPANPFDVNHPRWRDFEWAPAYDDDPDPVVADMEVAYK